MQVRSRITGGYWNYVIAGTHWHTIYTRNLVPHMWGNDRKVTYEGEECSKHRLPSALRAASP